jgi:hypothetical protein
LLCVLVVWGVGGSGFGCWGTGGTETQTPGDGSATALSGDATTRPDAASAGAVRGTLITGVRLEFRLWSLPAGTLASEPVFTEWVDEDRTGVAAKTLLRHNGMRAGLVREGGREEILPRLAEKGLSPPKTAEAILPISSSMSLPVGRPTGKTETLFLQSLEGTSSGRQYVSPAAGLAVSVGLAASEPDTVRLELVPEIIFSGEEGKPPERDPFRDLTLQELLDSLRPEPAAKGSGAGGEPSRGRAVEPGGSGTGGGAGRSTGGRELLESLRFSCQVPNGGTLLILPTKGAAKGRELGRLLLTDGPSDLGTETVVMVTARILRAVPAVSTDAGTGGER